MMKKRITQFLFLMTLSCISNVCLIASEYRRSTIFDFDDKKAMQLCGFKLEMYHSERERQRKAGTERAWIDSDAPDKDGRTYTMYLAFMNHPENLRALLYGRNQNIGALDARGYSVWDYARESDERNGRLVVYDWVNPTLNHGSGMIASLNLYCSARVRPLLQSALPLPVDICNLIAEALHGDDFVTVKRLEKEQRKEEKRREDEAEKEQE